jgi:hypothetical protein
MKAIFKRSPVKHPPEIESKFKQILKVQKITRRHHAGGTKLRTNKMKSVSNSDTVSFYTNDEANYRIPDPPAFKTPFQRFPLISMRIGVPHIRLSPPLAMQDNTLIAQPLIPDHRAQSVKTSMEGVKMPVHLSERIQSPDLGISIFAFNSKSNTIDSFDNAQVPPPNKFLSVPLGGRPPTPFDKILVNDNKSKKNREVQQIDIKKVLESLPDPFEDPKSMLKNLERMGRLPIKAVRKIRKISPLATKSNTPYSTTLIFPPSPDTPQDINSLLDPSPLIISSPKKGNGVRYIEPPDLRKSDLSHLPPSPTKG